MLEDDQQQYQEHLQSFARGVFAILDVWPAFRIARDHLNSPGQFAELRIRLAEELVDAFCSSTLPLMDELADFLQRFFDGELDLSLEDQSDEAVAKDLLLLWSTPHGPARDGTIERIAQHAREGNAIYHRIDDERGADSPSESSSGEYAEGDSRAYADDRDSSTMQVERASRAPSTAAATIDDEGFTLVQRRR